MMVSKMIRVALILGVVSLIAGSAWALPQDCDVVCTGSNPWQVCAVPGLFKVITCAEWEGYWLFAPTVLERLTEDSTSWFCPEDTMVNSLILLPMDQASP